MLRILLIVLTFLSIIHPAHAAEKPKVAFIFALDMSYSFHYGKVSGRKPADTQLLALATALEEIAEGELSCAEPFQMQVVFWGSHPKTVLDWQLLPNTAQSYQQAAAHIRALKPENLLGTDRQGMHRYVDKTLRASGSMSLHSVFTTNEEAYKSTIAQIEKDITGSPVQISGVSINDERARPYLAAVASAHTNITTFSELKNWFVEAVRKTIAPEACFVG